MYAATVIPEPPAALPRRSARAIWRAAVKCWVFDREVPLEEAIRRVNEAFALDADGNSSPES